MAYGKYELICTGGSPVDLYVLMVEEQLEYLILDPIPKKYIEDFVKGKRDTIINYHIEGIDLAFVPEEPEQVQHMLDLLNELDLPEFPIKEISIDMIKSYSEGNRPSLLTMELTDEDPNVSDEEESKEENTDIEEDEEEMKETKPKAKKKVRKNK